MKTTSPLDGGEWSSSRLKSIIIFNLMLPLSFTYEQNFYTSQ